MTMPQSLRLGLGAAIALSLLPVSPLWAHGAEDLTAETALHAWVLKPDIVAATVIVLLIYLVGMIRRWRARNAPDWWRHLAFVAGVGLVFLALASPIDPIAERAFWVHQIQHLLLRMAGPMLLALAAPEGVLTAGLPRWARRGLLRPVASNGAMRGLGHFLGRPVVAFLIFVLSLYFWEVPALHNVALLNTAVHYLMHITMLIAGLVFFRVIFDRRLPPASVGYGARQVMLLGAIVTNILLGAITALKSVVWYGAYDIDGRLFSTSPISDEQLGGFVIWVPGAMMLIIAVILTIYGWNKSETARFAQREGWASSNMAAIMDQPQTAEELWLKVEKPNRALALGLGTMTFSIFALLMSTMIVMAAWN